MYVVETTVMSVVKKDIDFYETEGVGVQKCLTL